MVFHTPPCTKSLLIHLSVTFLNKGEHSAKPASYIHFCLAFGKPVFRVSISGYLPDFVSLPLGLCKAGGELTTQVLCGCCHRGPHACHQPCVPCARQERGDEQDPSPRCPQKDPGQPLSPRRVLGSVGRLGRPCSSSPTIPGQLQACRHPPSSAERGWAGFWTGSVGSASGIQLLTLGTLPLCPLTPFFKIKPVKVGELCGWGDFLPSVGALQLWEVPSASPVPMYISGYWELLRCSSFVEGEIRRCFSSPSCTVHLYWTEPCSTDSIFPIFKPLSWKAYF